MHVVIVLHTQQTQGANVNSTYIVNAVSDMYLAASTMAVQS